LGKAVAETGLPAVADDPFTVPVHLVADRPQLVWAHRGKCSRAGGTSEAGLAR
jgi:hypothetical protein